MRICDGCGSSKEVSNMVVSLNGVVQWCIYGSSGNSIDLCRKCRHELHEAAISMFESKKPKSTQLSAGSPGSTPE